MLHAQYFSLSYKDCFQVIQGATEVIGVVRLGVSLVSYIHKVFSDICQTSDCGSIDTSVSLKR